MSDHARENDLRPAAVSPQPQTRVQRDVVMTAIRGCCRTDRVGLTEREIDALTQAIVDAYGPAAVSPQPEPPRDWLIFDAKDRLWWKPLAKGYTPNIDEAGRFTEYQAKGYESFTNDRHDIAIPLPTASQPPAVPVQDALTTLLPRIENWRERCLNRKFDNSSLEEDALTLLGDIEAALRREPPAVKEPVKP